MTLPTIHEVTSMFLYGTETPPDNFIDNDLTADRGTTRIDVDTDEFLDPDDGPGRFVVASNSVMMQRFFETAAADYTSGIFSAHQDASTGIVTMSKDELDEIYGLTANNIWHGIRVDNKWVYDDLDDYAARTYIYGNISFKISEDVDFVIYPDGRLEVKNFSLEVLDGDDFDWTTRVDDILTMLGNTVLKRAIDPSGIGQRVLLDFDAATPYVYTQEHFNDDVDRAGSISTVLNLLSISQAMGGVINDLYEEGTIQTVMDGKLVLYGSDNADTIGPYLSRTGVNVSDRGLDLPNPLHEHTDDGLIYVAGAGNDTVAGTGADDVLFGGSGTDSLFGGGGDDFIFFDFADGANVNGGAGRDVAVALGQGGVTIDMAAQALECVIGCDGSDTITVSGGSDALFAAGGGSTDTFNVTYDDEEGPKVLWGGAGADTFDFSFSEMPEYWWDEQLGLAVVNIDGLTEEIFASLSLADLGLGGINMSLIDAIVINPDDEDRFTLNGSEFQTSGWEISVPHEDFGLAFGVRPSFYLGGGHAIQSLFGIDVFRYQEFSKNYEYYDVVVSGDEAEETKVVPAEWSGGMFWSPWDQAYMPITPGHPMIQAAIAETEAEAANWFAENGTEEQTHWASDVPHFFCPFFVVGGSLSGSELNSNHSLTAPTPEDPGTTPFDWLLVA